MPRHLTFEQLTALSSNAVKIYYLLQSQSKEHCLRISIATLARQTALSPRSCKLALAELRAANHIFNFRRYHAPNTYLIPDSPLSAPSAQTKVQPIAPLSPTKGHPGAPINRTPAPKTQMGQPIAPLSMLPVAPKISTTLPPSPVPPQAAPSVPIDPDIAFCDFMEANVDLYKILMDQLSPADRDSLIAQAQATLARLPAPAPLATSPRTPHDAPY